MKENSPPPQENLTVLTIDGSKGGWEVHHVEYVFEKNSDACQVNIDRTCWRWTAGTVTISASGLNYNVEQ